MFIINCAQCNCFFLKHLPQPVLGSNPGEQSSPPPHLVPALCPVHTHPLRHGQHQPEDAGLSPSLSVLYRHAALHSKKH